MQLDTPRVPKVKCNYTEGGAGYAHLLLVSNDTTYGTSWFVLEFPCSTLVLLIIAVCNTYIEVASVLSAR